MSEISASPSFYDRRRVLVTGGLGFIGSNLARVLVELGADVVVIDSLLKDAGGRRSNVADLGGRLRVTIADVRDRAVIDALVADREVI